MNMLDATLRHHERAHAAMMGEVTWIERASLLRPLSEDDRARKLTLTRAIIENRRAAMGTQIDDDEPSEDGWFLFVGFVSGVIMTSILVLGAWVRFGG